MAFGIQFLLRWSVPADSLSPITPLSISLLKLLGIQDSVVQLDSVVQSDRQDSVGQPDRPGHAEPRVSVEAWASAVVSVRLASAELLGLVGRRVVQVFAVPQDSVVLQAVQARQALVEQ